MTFQAGREGLDVEIGEALREPLAPRHADLGEPSPHAVAGEQQVLALSGNPIDQRDADVDLAHGTEATGDAPQRTPELASLARMHVEQPQGFAQTTSGHTHRVHGIRVTAERPIPALRKDTEGNFRGGDRLRHRIFVVGCPS